MRNETQRIAGIAGFPLRSNPAYGLYGDRLERVVLYGLRARGDARPDSDYDVAMFLKDLDDRWEEIGKLVEIETDILCEMGQSSTPPAFPGGGLPGAHAFDA